MSSNQVSAALSALSDASNKQLPTESEVSEFSSKVDEVSNLIDGLAKGTISPQYVDSKLEANNSKVCVSRRERKAPSTSLLFLHV